jgi:hypothetical protein
MSFRTLPRKARTPFLEGLMSILSRYLRTVMPRKSKPAEVCQNTEEEHGSGRSAVPHPMLGAPIPSLLTWVAGDPTELLSAHTPCTL